MAVRARKLSCQVLWTRHGTGHPGETQDALAAHPAVKDKLFAHLFQWQDHARYTVVAQASKERSQELEELLSGAVDPLQRAGMVLDPVPEFHSS
jgi:hypothetical protein